MKILCLGRGFFFDIMGYLFYVQKALCSASYEEKKTYKPNNNSPLHLIIGKIKHPKSIGKVPRLAPKTKPETRRETIHRDVQERDPNPSAGPQVTLGKESRKLRDIITIAKIPNQKAPRLVAGKGRPVQGRD